MEKATGGQAVRATLESRNDPGGELGRPAALTAFTLFGQFGTTRTLQGSEGTRGGEQRARIRSREEASQRRSRRGTETPPVGAGRRREGRGAQGEEAGTEGLGARREGRARGGEREAGRAT